MKIKSLKYNRGKFSDKKKKEGKFKICNFNWIMSYLASLKKVQIGILLQSSDELRLSFSAITWKPSSLCCLKPQLNNYNNLLMS